jgi:hypothetical protein
LTAVAAGAQRAAPPTTDEIEIVISDRVEDVGEVLSVVHDGFVEAGYARAQPSGKRVHPAYLNPGTVFALARIDGEPVGAAVGVADGPFGLPSDRAFAEENDALRGLGPEPVLECGSLVVRAPWRRHTRRVFARAISGLIRVGLVDFPGSRIVITATPETERFYGAMFGMRRLAEPRPLYGAPALLMHPGTIEEMARYCRRGESSSQRAMDRLLRETRPSWILDRRAGQPLPDGWLRELVEEQDAAGALAAQIRLLASRYPSLLQSMLRDAAYAPLVAA